MEKHFDDLNESILKLLAISHTEEYRTFQVVYRLCCRCLSQIQTYNQTSNSVTNNPVYPSNSVDAKFSERDLDELFVNVNNLDKFLWFVFTRRYGFLDQNNKDSTKDLTCLQVSPRGQKSGFTNLLDVFIKWFQLLRPAPAIVEGYVKLIANASALPVVRNRSVVHILTWLQSHHHDLNSYAAFQSVKGLLLMCITDVWSPIRKASCNRLGAIIDLLPNAARDDFFNDLVVVCLDTESAWQAKDGAIAAINALLHHFLSGRMDSEAEVAMPEVVSRHMHSVIFSLVCHPQLTIRETAAKAFSLYISSTNQKEILNTLDKVMSLLTSDEKCDNKNAGCCFVDAYKAEGLLSICHFILKFLPKYHLMMEWCKYSSMFVGFLSHPASTVRQCTSNIFKLLVQRSSNNPVLFQLVLQSLTNDWNRSLEDNVIPREPADSWEGREGRLFAYESICRYVIKDHMCKMFGPEASHKPKLQSELSEEERCLTRHSDCTVGCRKLVSSFDGHSLLNQTKMLDAFYAKVTVGQSNERIEEIQDTIMRLCVGGSETTKYEDVHIASLRFVSCRSLLEVMLYETAECLADSQWELRRIALQVFPYLAEVIRWYDCKMMLDIWKQIGPACSSLNMYMALYLLKESVVHGSRLQPLLFKPGQPCKGSPMSREAVKGIVDCIQCNIHSCLSVVENILKRNCFDQLSILSAEIIAVSLINFDIPQDQTAHLGGSVIVFWKNLFSFAHPNSRISQELFSCGNNFTSPHCGYLSCCLVPPEGNTQCARQVEKMFMKKMVGSLQAFLCLQSLSDAAVCLPMLAHNVGLLVGDVYSCKSLLKSLSMASHSVVDRVLKLTAGEERQSCLRAIFFTLKELAAVIAMKSFDSQLLQKTLNVYLSMCRPINPTRHLRIIFKSVCARMGERERLQSCDLSPRPEQDSEIGLFWRHSSISQVEGPWSEPDEDDQVFPDEDFASMYSECLGLNVSSNSGSFSFAVKSQTGSVCVEEESHNGEDRQTDEDSDWDSWSDEEEDDSTLMSMFSSFLRQMKNVFGKDASAIFSKEISALVKEERLFITTLVGDVGLQNS